MANNQDTLKEHRNIRYFVHYLLSNQMGHLCFERNSSCYLMQHFCFDFSMVMNILEHEEVLLVHILVEASPGLRILAEALHELDTLAEKAFGPSALVFDIMDTVELPQKLDEFVELMDTEPPFVLLFDCNCMEYEMVFRLNSIDILLVLFLQVNKKKNESLFLI